MHAAAEVLGLDSNFLRISYKASSSVLEKLGFCLDTFVFAGSKGSNPVAVADSCRPRLCCV